MTSVHAQKPGSPVSVGHFGSLNVPLTTEGSDAVLVGREVRRRPEEDSTQAVKRKPHKNSNLVPLSFHNLSGNRREEQVAATEVNNLKAGRLKLGDIEDSLEMLVEDI
jgi:hypothetical protein